MGIMAEDVFSCLNCSSTVVFEPYHTTGIEVCTKCNSKHSVKVGKTKVTLYDESADRHVNNALLEIESWPDWKKEYYYKLLKLTT